MNGFDGIFCEHKIEADHLLFISTTANDFEIRFNDKLFFNKDGRLIGESTSIDENSGAYRSCSTMLNGEAIIFGGNHVNPTDIIRQVYFNCNTDEIVTRGFFLCLIQDFCGVRMYSETTW